MRIDRKFNKFQWIIYASIVKIRIVQETLEPTVIVVPIRNNNFKDTKRDTYAAHFYYKTIAIAFRRKQIPRIGNTNRTQAERNNVICRLRETILKIRNASGNPFLDILSTFRAFCFPSDSIGFGGSFRCCWPFSTILTCKIEYWSVNGVSIECMSWYHKQYECVENIVYILLLLSQQLWYHDMIIANVN